MALKLNHCLALYIYTLVPPSVVATPQVTRKYSKTFLNQLTIGPTLNSPCREMGDLGNWNIFTMVLYEQ